MVTRADGGTVTTSHPADRPLSDDERRLAEQWNYSGGQYVDQDGDGRDDTTGLAYYEHLERVRDVRDRYEAARRAHGAQRAQQSAAETTREQMMAEQEARDEEARYRSSGDRTRDLDAGTPGASRRRSDRDIQRERDARYRRNLGGLEQEANGEEGTGYRDRYTGENDGSGGMGGGGGGGGPGSSYGGGGGGGYGGGYDPIYGNYRGPEGSAMSRADDATRIAGQIPIVGDGIRAGWAAEDAANEAARMRAAWETLQDWAPTANDLAVDYETGAQDFDPESLAAARDALRSMQDVYQSGGMTAADRSRQMQARYSTGQQMRATREADQAALQARGIGGGGASVASMLGAQQAGAMGLAMQDASMLQDAQRRALQAMQSSGQQALSNANAVNAFNQWRHGLTTQTRESRSRSRQQSFDNQASIRAGLTNQWRGAASDASESERRKQDASNAQAGAIGTLINTVTS